MTDKDQVAKLIADVVKEHGRLDVMVNNAGLMAIAPLSLAQTDEWDRMIDINIKGLLYGVAAALPVFEKQQSGHFVNIASVVGIKVFSPGGTVYSGTKFAVRAISEGLRHEVGAHIRTTVISPGAIDTELKYSAWDRPRDALVAITRDLVSERGFVSEDAKKAFFEAGHDEVALMEILAGVALKTISNYLDHLSPVSIDPAFQAEAQQHAA